MSIRINKPSFLHIDDPNAEKGYTLIDCRIVGTVGPNPFYRTDPDEPKYTVSDIRVKDRNGRDITAAVEDWEFTRIYEELIQGYGDAAEEAADQAAQAQIETALFTRQPAAAL